VHKIQLALLASSWAYSIFYFFRRLGPFGLLLLGTLDSSFLFLPFGNDLLLIALVSSSGSRLEWILYVSASAVGSVIGVLLIDLPMRKAGESGLRRFVKPKRIKQLEAKMENNAGWAVFLATLVPPPFPFTPVVMTASAFQVSRKKLLGSVLLGRIMRFGLEAMLAIYFHQKLLRYMNSDLLEYLVYGFVTIASVGSVFSILKWVHKGGSLTGTSHEGATKTTARH
jgi:membrane protein YqaA with SNARE-associated domain